MKKIKLAPLEEALDKVLAHIEPVKLSEYVSIFDARGRILAQDLIVQKELPCFDNSAMDGYGVLLCDAGKEVSVSAEFFAGDAPLGAVLESGKAFKIMTGAVVESGVEAVVPFEDVKAQKNGKILLPPDIKKGANIRKRGEEFTRGAGLLAKGSVLDAAKIALIASQGLSVVPVFARPRVAVVSSGNEIKEPWQNAAAHQIFNSNSIAVYTFLKDLGLDPVYIPSLPDDKKQIEKVAKKLLAAFDFVLEFGGVSVGEADFTIDSFERAGLDVVLHGVLTKPGKHGVFGTSGKTGAYFMGMPGNPLSSMAMYLLLAKPAILKLMGAAAYHHNFSYARVKEDFAFGGKRANVIFGTLSAGEFAPYKGYKYSSGMISPLALSNAFIVSKEGTNGFKKGDLVKVFSSRDHQTSDFVDFFSR